MVISGASKLYQDTLIIEALLAEPELMKTAQVGGLVSGIIDKVKNYASAHIDENNKVESVLSLIVPGVLAALGFRWISLIVGIATQVFHVNIGAIFSKIASGVGSLLHGGEGQVTSQQIDALTEQAVGSEFDKPVSDADIESFQKSQHKSEGSFSLKDAVLLKEGLVNFTNENPDIDFYNPQIKNAQLVKFLGSVIVSLFTGTRQKSGNILVKVIGWIIKVILATAGFMVAGDVVNKLIGRPNAIDSTLQISKLKEDNKPTSAPAPLAIPSAQKKFKLNPSFNDEEYNISDRWIEAISPSSIGDLILSWAKEIYPDLKGKESLIRSSIGFKKAIEVIQKYNTDKSATITYIPKLFTSKKTIVDLFIDEVAQRSS